MHVATVLTVYGIETVIKPIGLNTIPFVATVLTVYGIETIPTTVTTTIATATLQQYLPFTVLKQAALMELFKTSY